ncbi:nuclear transport factor 2 family protein [Mesorhizobium sp. LSHC422A00]
MRTNLEPRFTDYLSLLKIAGEWKIVSKLYHLHH